MDVIALDPVLHAMGGLELTPLELCRRLGLDELRCGEVESALLSLVLRGFVEATAHGTYRERNYAETRYDMRLEYDRDANLIGAYLIGAALRDVVQSLAKPSKCCGMRPRITQPDPYASRRTQLVCPGCYDGAPDAGPQNAVEGEDPQTAVQAWNEEQDDGE